MKVKTVSIPIMSDPVLLFCYLGSEAKAKGSQDFIEILEEDEDEVSPLPKSSLGEWNSERKQVRI